MLYCAKTESLTGLPSLAKSDGDMTPTEKTALNTFITYVTLDDIYRVVKDENEARAVMDGLIKIRKFLDATGFKKNDV